MQQTHSIGNVVKMGLLLEFQVAFSGEQPLSIEEYLKGGSRNVILKVATFLLGFKNYESRFRDNRTLLQAIFSSENSTFANSIYQTVRKLEREKGRVDIVNA